MITSKYAFEQELRSLLATTVAAETEAIVSVPGAANFDTYRYRIGRISAFREVNDLIDEANRNLDKR